MEGAASLSGVHVLVAVAYSAMSVPVANDRHIQVEYRTILMAESVDMKNSMDMPMHVHIR